MAAEQLLERLSSPENLLAAWRAVRGNIPRYRRTRSAGPDGVSLAEFERDLPAQLAALRDMLLKERYQPQPPAQFTLQKKGGGQRQISILSVRDRVAQRAAQQVLEPLWEPEFLDCSFGYRPGISIENAILCVQALRRQGNQWVVDGDIATCFDTLDHDLLMALLKRKVRDGRVLRLLQVWLDAGVIQSGLPQEPPEELAARLKSLSSVMQRGLDWALDSMAQETDPYGAARYEMMEGSQLGEQTFAFSDRQATLSGIRRSALKRMLTAGLLWGASWARPAIENLGATARTTLSSPAGRRLLKRGALATSGLAGVAAAAAAASYLLQRKAGPAPSGVLQGSPLSPLLANLYLHPFDVMIAQKAGHSLVRFADDWVILCPTQSAAEAAYNDALLALARLRLKINPEKTRILSPEEGLEWLGAMIR